MTPSGPRSATQKQQEAQELIDKFAKDLRALNEGKVVPARWKNYLLKALTVQPERQKPGPKVDYDQVTEIVKRLMLGREKRRTKTYQAATVKAQIAKDLGINRKTVSRIAIDTPYFFREVSRLDGLDPKRRQAIIEGLAAVVAYQMNEDDELERKAREQAMRRRFPQRFPPKK